MHHSPTSCPVQTGAGLSWRNKPSPSPTERTKNAINSLSTTSDETLSDRQSRHKWRSPTLPTWKLRLNETRAFRIWSIFSLKGRQTGYPGYCPLIFMMGRSRIGWSSLGVLASPSQWWLSRSNTCFRKIATTFPDSSLFLFLVTSNVRFLRHLTTLPILNTIYAKSDTSASSA